MLTSRSPQPCSSDLETIDLFATGSTLEQISQRVDCKASSNQFPLELSSKPTVTGAMSHPDSGPALNCMKVCKSPSPEHSHKQALRLRGDSNRRTSFLTDISPNTFRAHPEATLSLLRAHPPSLL
jgi:hypothetical protein